MTFFRGARRHRPRIDGCRVLFLTLVGLLFLSGCASVSSDTKVPAPIRPSIATLRGAIERDIAGFEGVVGVYVRDLTTGDEVAIRADETFPTASLVKVPILLKLLQRVDAKEVSWTEPLVYTKARLYPGEDLLARFEDKQKVALHELIALMESLSDNTASLWCQEIAGGGVAINAWLASKGFSATRVNSRTTGREKDREAWGWGQTTPREMAELLALVRARKAVSAGADAYAERVLSRSWWTDEALSSLPPHIHAMSKQGAVNASRSEVVLVDAPTGAFVLCVITKKQKDQSWEPGNAGFRLLRSVTASCWAHFAPSDPYPPALGGPTWP
jgi:beta-lactamase class A